MKNVTTLKNPVAEPAKMQATKELPDYHFSFKVDINPEQVIEHISNVSGWWASHVEGESKNINDRFIVRFGSTYAQIRITESDGQSRIVWLIDDCNMDLLKDKKEWKDTRIVWDISKSDGITTVSMKHLGLNADKECFTDCTAGWNFYLGESLVHFLTKNNGLPGTGIMASIVLGNRVYKGTLFSKEQSLTDFPLGFLLIDVKETNVEQVVAAYSVGYLNSENFNRLKGNFYMILENIRAYGEIEPLDDLQALTT